MDISTISYEVSVAKFSLVHRVSQICTIMTGSKIDVIDVTHLYIICNSQVMLPLDLELRSAEIHLQYLTWRILFEYGLDVSELCVVPFVWLKSRLSMMVQIK